MESFKASQAAYEQNRVELKVLPTLFRPLTRELIEWLLLRIVKVLCVDLVSNVVTH